MRILFPMRRFNVATSQPLTHVEYYFYQALIDNDFNVLPLGPYHEYRSLLDLLLGKLHGLVTRKRFLKDPLLNVWRISNEVNRAVDQFKPDLIFAVTSPPFVFYTGQVPYIIRADSFSLTNQKATDNQSGMLGHSNIGLKITKWEEHRTLKHSAKVITHSTWSRDSLVSDYGVNSQKIVVLPLAAPLPETVVPSTWTLELQKKMIEPLKLLFVGRDAHRKGLDIATEVVRLLNETGIVSELTVCGAKQPDQLYAHFAGSFNKSNPEELQAYVDYYKHAHFVLHPARFEPYGQLTSEAAAFGTPVITNDVGGLASAVTPESGVVLPAHSPASAYVDVIKKLWLDPKAYHELCASAHSRFVRDLNWKVLGKRLVEVLEDVHSLHRNQI
ncbi:MAG: glycosyltransferase family 4 protein [Anaerolineae bacterium]|nr:glycosyltransferase family 4 protein [Anaerolineae bacterium]